jgi:hypothetical protein
MSADLEPCNTACEKGFFHEALRGFAKRYSLLKSLTSDDVLKGHSFSYAEQAGGRDPHVSGHDFTTAK